MTNPINNGSKPPLDRPLGESQRNRAAVGDAQTTASGQQQPATEAGNRDSASLSPRLQAALDGIRQTPDVDQARVDALRQSIADGSYPVDADKIANRMIDLERLLER